MNSATMLWAGKPLSDEEELRTRRFVAKLRRMGKHELADGYERFLPENDARWTPDELELGAHVGPWLDFGDVAVEPDPGLEADAA